MKKGLFSLGLVLLLGTVQSFSQSMTNAEKIEQVFAEFVPMLSTEQYSWLENCISRVEIIDLNTIPSTNVKALNDVPLMDKYGATLTRDYVYDAATFNPLKYAFNFMQSTDQYFQIGTTDKAIKINKQD